MKNLSLLILSLLIICAASAASACAPGQTPPESVKKEPPAVKGEALVLVRVPEAMRASKERNKLFAALCGEIARAAGAEPVYVSPVYEDSQSGTAHFKSPLETAEIIERLKKDRRVIGASPNRVMKMSAPAKVR